jgi:hypothetical protein
VDKSNDSATPPDGAAAPAAPVQTSALCRSVQRSFLLGRSMGDAVMQEREETVSMLIGRGLHTAALATRTSGSFGDFFKMRGFFLAGGLRVVRVRGGRGIDR